MRVIAGVGPCRCATEEPARRIGWPGRAEVGSDTRVDRIVAIAGAGADTVLFQTTGHLKLQRANFRLKLKSMLDMFQQVLEFDQDEDEKSSSVSYLVRPKDTNAG